jgi:hypothetical protein
MSISRAERQGAVHRVLDLANVRSTSAAPATRPTSASRVVGRTILCVAEPDLVGAQQGNRLVRIFGLREPGRPVVGVERDRLEYVTAHPADG